MWFHEINDADYSQGDKLHAEFMFLFFLNVSIFLFPHKSGLLRIQLSVNP